MAREPVVSLEEMIARYETGGLQDVANLAKIDPNKAREILVAAGVTIRKKGGVKGRSWGGHKYVDPATLRYTATKPSGLSASPYQKPKAGPGDQ